MFAIQYMQEASLSDIITLTATKPFQETVTVDSLQTPQPHQPAQQQPAETNLAKLEQCATQLAQEVIGDGAKITVDKQSPHHHFKLEAKGDDTTHLEGVSFGNLLAKAKGWVGLDNASAFNFSVTNSPQQYIAMSVVDQRGNPENPETFRRAAAYIALDGKNVQTPGTIQTGKVGELDLGQLSATDSLGVKAVKKLRDCMR